MNLLLTKLGPVSAFAARKAARPSTTVTRPPIETNALPVTEASGEADAPARPKKRRKGGERPNSLGTPQPATEEKEPSVPITKHEDVCTNGEDAGDIVTEGETDRYADIMTGISPRC